MYVYSFMIQCTLWAHIRYVYIVLFVLFTYTSAACICKYDRPYILKKILNIYLRQPRYSLDEDPVTLTHGVINDLPEFLKPA